MSIRMSIFDELFDKAANTEKVAGAQIAAALVSKNKIVIGASNSKKTHPFQKKYGKNSEAICLHAEIHTVVKALNVMNVDDISKHDLYIARARKADRRGPFVWGNAAPCAACRRMISAFGIRNVYFTTDENNVVDYL